VEFLVKFIFRHAYPRAALGCPTNHPPKLELLYCQARQICKLQEEEYFASRSPLVAEAQHKAERGRRIDLLAEGMLLHALYPEVEAAQGLTPPNAAEQTLYAEFLAARRVAEAASLYAHDSGRYPLTGVGDVNTYALFSETFAQLVSAQGCAGFIVPTGIATDDSTKAFFAAQTQNSRLVTLYDIENREAIFPSVHRSYKFCLLTLGAAAAAEFVCFAAQVTQLADPRRRFKLTPQDFVLINPNTLTCPVFRSEYDAELTKKLYRVAPVLVVDSSPEANPWGIQIRRVFDMAKAEVVGACLREPLEGFMPMYEAKMIHQFDHRWASYSAEGSSCDISASRKIDPSFRVLPRYWVNAVEVKSRLADKGWNRGWIIAWRDICRATDERTVIAAILPQGGTDFTLRVNVGSNNLSPNLYACLLANLNSITTDFCARQKIGGTHLADYIIKQLPVLPPASYVDADLAFIVPRVLELTYTAHELKPWAADLGYDGEPFPWNPERRSQLRAELDAYYARLYRLTRDEVRYILDPTEVMGEDYPSETFRVLKNNDMREFGEYHTRRLILAAWDAVERKSVAEITT
jgi:hypothetical protein